MVFFYKASSEVNVNNLRFLLSLRKFGFNYNEHNQECVAKDLSKSVKCHPSLTINQTVKFKCRKRHGRLSDMSFVLLA